jgi:hypothetical protein
MKIDRVIIWGHKPRHYHTHSHIHSSYYKAFKSLGYETYWFDNDDAKKIQNMNFDGSLFFTEGQVDQKIPLNEKSAYILHHCKNDKYLQAGNKILNLCNYLKYCEEGISFNYKDTGNTVEKFGDFLFYDQKALALYQPWATDLLPDEINLNNPCMFDDSKKDVNYIGSIWEENINQIRPFIQACKDHRKRFRHFKGGISDERNQRLVQKSFISPDIRGEWHKECGYIPCRIFKNISYGQVAGINSLHVYEKFNGLIAYSEDTYELFNACVGKAKSISHKQIIDSMIYIRDYHTYINRINNLLRFIDL